jgi:hypothetical protein
MRSPEDFPEDIREKASQIAGAIDRCFSVYQDSASLNYEEASEIIARALMERDRAATETERERWKPAAVYFERYCQDEADEVENCVCGQQQHDDAKAFAAAIRSQP